MLLKKKKKELQISYLQRGNKYIGNNKRKSKLKKKTPSSYRITKYLKHR